ncbi:unnamed protein product [Symbiodinium sp. CCMP2592]|nr:unnamed protein product [Symbiodinium sp. CCMP2592]
MLEQEMDTYADLPAPAEADGAAEPGPKRQRTADGADARAPDAGGAGLMEAEEPAGTDALESTLSQIMQTDFDISSVPAESAASDIPATEGCILREVSELERTIADYGPSSSWSSTFRHVVQGALAVHRLRLLDVSRREEVLFLELVEGSGRHVRAHGGQCFFYSEHGHWNAYKGVIPEGTLARCKKFLVQLEGLYASFHGNVFRDHDGILKASQELLERHSLQSDILLTACEKAAICRMPPKSKGSNPGEVDDVQDPGDDKVHWTVAMANTIGKLYVKLQTSLLNDSIIKYYIAWCSQDVKPAGGFCTTDAAFAFTADGLHPVRKTPRNNMYVYLPRRMLDPVAEDVRKRVELFWKTTYWANAEAVQVFMASFVLAPRGENVDRAFWSIGSGGVGQSLQTAHLEAILGEYHTCLDMNIYFVDEEMRKQAANIVGKIVVTGQESVQGSRRSMREDIYKKHISADKVPERLPYAIHTALVELRGWKRFELNTAPKFGGVTDETINSILRRTAVCAYKSSFVDPARIAGREELAASHGIFPRDPTLKDFLRDNPACLVTLRCVWNYARNRTAEQCRDVLEKYVVRGGDCGLTLATVRRSCGLTPNETPDADPVREVLDALSKKAAASAVAEPSAEVKAAEVQAAAVQATVAKHKAEQEESVSQLRDWLVAERKDWFTAAQLKSAKAKFVFNFNRCDAQQVIDKMLASGRLVAAPTVLPKVGQTTLYLPVYFCEKSLDAVVSLVHDTEMTFIEAYHVSGVRSRLAADSSRSLNIRTLAENYKKKDAAQQPNKKKGAPKRNADVDAADSSIWEDLIQALDRQTSLHREVLEAAQEADSTDENLYVKVQRQYFYPRDIRCRRYVTEVGAQSMSRLTRAICCPQTADYDIASAMFNIVVQLCDMVQPTGLEIPSWRAIATNRSRVCSDQLKCTESVGKKILTEVANGAMPSNFKDIPKQGLAFLTALSTESRRLRWLACSQLQSHYLQLRRGSRTQWPEASIFALWWTAAEDLILQSMTCFVRQGEAAEHVSCHFDGILVARSLVQSLEETTGKNMVFLLEEAVLKNTNFKVVLKDKTVPSLDTLLDSRLKPSQVSSQLRMYEETLTAVSNSIPAAMVFLGADVKQIILRLREESPANTKAETRHLRQYSDWNGCGDLHLVPRSAFTTEAASDFLLHLELPESSICMGVKMLPNNMIGLMRGGRVFEGSMFDLMDLLEAFHGLKETFCFDAVSKSPELDDGTSGFLDLLAGSSSGGTSKKRPAAQADAVQGQGPRNEGEVDVGGELLNLMKREIEEALDNVNCQASTTFSTTTCPCCPWRRFSKRAHLRQHLTSQHTTAKRYCPSGTKQLRIAVSMYDQDAIKGKEMQPYFLSRAAAVMRLDVKPPVPTKVVEIDSFVRYVFDKDGPIIMALHTIKKRHDLRRVGNLYYTHAFACAFLEAAAAANGSLHKICCSFLRCCKRHDGELSSLLPRSTNSFWINVFEDLMNAPPVLKYRDALLQECRDHNEFRYLSIDATFKVNLKIIGQANFHSSQSLRDDAAIPEAEAAYRTLTCRGRTGAALLVAMVRSEKASVIADALANELSLQQRTQVQHVASDNPSPEMFRVLRQVLPHLESIALDAMHIIMVYQQNMSNKKTHGSRWLAVIMDKFRKRDAARTAAAWGPFYTGQSLPPASVDVRCMRLRLEKPDMSHAQAHNLLEKLNPDTPWLTEIDFLEACVAHLSLFADEVSKTTYSGASLHRLIINVASAVKVQWLFNDTRHRHAVHPGELTLLPSGTTSNESLHHEINHWFRETAARLQRTCAFPTQGMLPVSANHPEAALHKSTFGMKLNLFHFVKLFTHNQALYRPLQRQADQSEIASRAMKANVRFMLPQAAWRTWCRQLKAPGATPARAALHVLKQGRRVRVALRDKATASLPEARASSSKPKAPRLPRSKPTRRTPFRLRNLSPVIRPGRRSKEV